MGRGTGVGKLKGWGMDKDCKHTTVI